MVSFQNSHRSQKLSRVCPLLQKVYQRVLHDGIISDHYLRQKNIVFKWDQDCQEAFAKLRTAVKTAPVLRIFQPDKAEELEVHTDASQYAMGAALLQRLPGDKSFYPVAFLSRTLNQAQ